MTPEKQRIAIAEACEYVNLGVMRRGTVIRQQWQRPGKSKLDQPAEILPDYPNDLNAMHEAETSLSDDCAKCYASFLGSSLGMNPGYFADQPSFSIHEWERLIQATASQRAEAFLRTIGKWEATK